MQNIFSMMMKELYSPQSPRSPVIERRVTFFTSRPVRRGRSRASDPIPVHLNMPVPRSVKAPR